MARFPRRNPEGSSKTEQRIVAKCVQNRGLSCAIVAKHTQLTRLMRFILQSAGLVQCSTERRVIMQAGKPSLYDRLGGVYNIATVVDDFIDRIMVDPRLNANPLVDEAHHRVPPAGFKYLVTEMVCWATGGPQKYTGKSMKDSHAHLKITSKEWEAFLDDFQQTLDKFKVPVEEQADLKAIVNSTRSDIVIESALPAAGSS